MASTSASLLPNMITDHTNTTTEPRQVAFCPPLPNSDFQSLDSSVPYFVNASLDAALAIPTTFANLVVLLAMRRVSSIRLPSKLLLCSLVLTDLGAGLIVLPQYAVFLFIKASPGFNPSVCPLVLSLNVNSTVFSGASLLTLTAMSLDRYAALFFHLKYQQIVTTRRVCAVLAVIWLASLFSATSLLWNVFLLWVLLAVGLCSAPLVISVAHIKVYRRLKSLQVHPHEQAQQPAGNSPNMERYRRTASAMMWIYVGFVICYLPYLCLGVVTSIRPTALTISVRDFTYTLLLLNSCLNPFVYCLRLPDIRTEVIKQLRKFCCQCS